MAEGQAEHDCELGQREWNICSSHALEPLPLFVCFMVLGIKPRTTTL